MNIFFSTLFFKLIFIIFVESVLITSRLNAPLIQIIPDGSPPLPSSEGEINNMEGASSDTGNYRPGLNNTVDLFYTNESNRSSFGGQQFQQSGVRHNQDVRNSLPRVSLTSLGRAFTPRSSWNGSKNALLQLQRKTSSSRPEGGVPGYLAKKYHLSSHVNPSRSDQV